MQDLNEKSEIGRLRRRADFLRVAKGKHWHAGALTVQAAARVASVSDGDASARLGFTLTRKVGNAVVRNRARRRLKEAARLAEDLPVRAAHDYVIVGRIGAVTLPFERLTTELVAAVAAVHVSGRPGRSKPPSKKRSQNARPKRTGPQP